MAAKKEATSTALVKFPSLEERGFALAKFSTDMLRQTVAANLGDEGISPNDLTRIRIPSGGQKVWTVTRLDGEEEHPKTLTGIVLMTRIVRAYWPGAYEGGNEPPQCAANDGRRGIGDPGGVCKVCPLNEFGSADGEKRGKACKEMRLVFLLGQGSLLPDVVVLPPTSIQPLRKYITQLTGAAIPYTGIMSEIGLTEKQNADGIKYSQATFRMASKLDEASAAHVEQFATAMRSALEAVAADSLEAESEE